MPAYEPPHPDEIWLYGGVLAVLDAAGVDSLGYTVSASGLEYTDGSGSGWEFVWVEGGGAAISGRDVDFGREVETDALMAGAPDWVRSGWMQDWAGFFFWWDGTAWACGRGQQEDDPNGSGITGSVDRFDDRLADVYLHPWMVDAAGGALEERGDESEFEDLVERLVDAAREGRLGETELNAVLPHLVEPGYRTVPAALAAATRAGFTPGAVRPEVPAANR